MKSGRGRERGRGCGGGTRCQTSVNVKMGVGEMESDGMRRLAAVTVVELRCDEVVCWMSGYEGISTVVEDELRNSSDAGKF